MDRYILETPSCHLDELLFSFASEERSFKTHSSNGCCPRTSERIENEIPCFRACTKASFNQRYGFLGRVFPECFFFPARRCELPDCFHLFAAGFTAHVVVVERVTISTTFLGLSSPKNCFRRVCKTSATEVGRWIRLFPRNVIENAEAQLQHRKPNAQINVKGTSHPNGSFRLQNSITLRQPSAISFVVNINPQAPIPFTFIDLDSLASNTGKSII